MTVEGLSELIAKKSPSNPVTREAISRFMNGRKAYRSTIAAIAGALGVDPGVIANFWDSPGRLHSA